MSQTVWAPADDEEPVGERHGFLQRGDQLGRYLILSRLGTGGMGVVYAAYDPDLDRKVALKLLRRASADPQRRDAAQKRLMQEARAMARLAHPNVISVHDVAVLDGRVVVAMEYVDGLTLSELLEREDVPLSERLEIMMAAGEGLAAAHEGGVVHRDFKPENVMVALGDGKSVDRVRVMDFGLARALDDATSGPATYGGMSPEDIELAAGSTGNVQRMAASDAADPTGRSRSSIMGTPAYMAPEQHEGRSTDARTDQFGFCVTMYEVLYGTRPFAGETPQQIAQSIAAANVAPPPEDTRVPAWIHAVILRGLAVSPDDRYPSMKALLAALRRDPAVRRRQWATRGGVAVLVVAGAFGVGQVIFDDPCRGAQRRLDGVWDDARRAEVEAAFEAVDKPYAKDALTGVTGALDRYASSWTEMHRDACEATRVRGEQSDELLDLRMQCLGRLRAELDALVQLFVAADAELVQQSLDATYSLVPVATCGDVEALRAPVAPPDDPAARAKLEALRDRLAQLKAYEDAGRFADGLKRAPDLVSAARELGYAPLLADALYRHARLAFSVDDLDTTETLLREAIQVAASGRYGELEARAWIMLTRVVGYARAKAQRGEELAEAAHAAVTRAGSPPELRADLASARGAMLHATAELDRAEALFRETLAIERERLDPDHPLLANALNNLAAVLVQRAQYEEAQQLLADALTIYERSFGQEHPNGAKLRMNLGVLLLAMRQPKQARENLERAASVWEHAFGPDHPDVARALINLSNVALVQGKHREARMRAAKAVEILEPHLGRHPQLAMALGNEGAALVALGRVGDALEPLEEALSIHTETLGLEHTETQRVLVDLGEAYLRLQRFDDARQALEPVVDTAVADGDEQTLGVRTRARLSLAKVLWRIGDDKEEALAMARAARTDAEQLSRPLDVGVPSAAEIDAFLAGK